MSFGSGFSFGSNLIARSEMSSTSGAGGAAASAVVERPPHRLPEGLDALGVAAGQQRRQVTHQQRVDRGAAGADRVGVAHALGSVGIAHARGDQIEGADRPVRAVGQRDGQRDAVVVGLEVCNPSCLCAPKGTEPPSATDALVCLRGVTGQTVTLDCPCP